MSSRLGHIAVVTWAPGGNLPPLLAAGALLAARGHHVRVLASCATRPAAEHAGFDVRTYRHAPEPETRVAFERQAGAMMATAAGLEIARDVRDMLDGAPTDLAVVDCMLPAGLAAAKAAATPAASSVHFLYGLARRQLIRAGGAWTTDLHTLNATRSALGLAAAPDGLSAWEAPELLLVTAPRWLDVALAYPPHVIHAGPLAIDAGTAARTDRDPRRVLLSFSTTVMEGQPQTIQHVCDALAVTATRATLTLGPAVEATAVRIPDTIEITPWADHDELLRTCAAVITHGGLGTTLRALAHGVPLLFLPLGRDQAFNAGQVTDLGAGIALAPDARPTDIRSALDALLRDPSYSAAAASAAARIASDRPDRRAVEALEGCLAGRR